MRGFSQYVVLFMTLLASLQSVAEVPKAYIRWEPGLFEVPKLIVNKKEVNRSFWSGGRYDVAQAMADNPAAKEFAEKHESYAAWGMGVFWVGLAGTITYGFVSAHNDNFNEGIYFGSLIVWLLVSGGLIQTSQAYLHKAINTYNGIPPEIAKFQFSVQPLFNGGTLGLSYAF